MLNINIFKFQSVINYAIKLDGTISICKVGNSRILCNIYEEHITGKTKEGYNIVNIMDSIHNIDNAEVVENLTFLFESLGFKYISKSYECVFFGMQKDTDKVDSLCLLMLQGLNLREMKDCGFLFGSRWCDIDPWKLAYYINWNHKNLIDFQDGSMIFSKSSKN